MRLAASKQSSLKYHLVPPARLRTPDIFRKALFNHCLPLEPSKNATASNTGSQARPTYAIQKRHPYRGINDERGAFRNFTCNTITVGSAATIVGQNRIHPHPTVKAIES